MRFTLRVPLLSFALVLSTAAGAAAPQDQTIRSQVRVVAVDVRVFDSEDRFVSDLTAADFELYEDGVRQDVQLLYRVSEPAGQPGARRIEPLKAGITAEPWSGSAARARQTWIFFFDENHLTPGAGFDRARQAAIDFLEDGFPTGDLAGVVAGAKMVDNRLTSVREELLAAVMKVKPPTAARARQLEAIESGWRLWGDAAEGSFRGLDRRRRAAEAERDRDQSLNTIRALLEQLQSIEGPKTIVYLSDGFSFGASPEDFAAGTDTYSTSIFGTAMKADARFYTIDVRGLNGPELSVNGLDWLRGHAIVQRGQSVQRRRDAASIKHPPHRRKVALKKREHFVTRRPAPNAERPAPSARLTSQTRSAA